MARTQPSSLMLHLMKYTFISGLALAVDLFSFQLFSRVNLLSVPEGSTISYCIGLCFAYLVFVKSIFSGSIYAKRASYQIFLFGISGIIGVVSTFVVSTISHDFFGTNRWESKISAVICSFFIVYWYRKKYVFPRSECIG
jgi:putative flippase GtrA